MIALEDHAPDGNLANVMRLDRMKIDKSEAIWCSDFHTFNENCPDRVRNWLQKNYRARYRKNA